MTERDLATDKKLVHGRSEDDQMSALSRSVMAEMQLNSQRQRMDETTVNKLLRSADVVIGGTIQGTVDNGKQALSDPATLVKFGSSALLASGLTLAQSKAGLLRLSAQAGSLALAGAFAKDIYGKGEETLGIVQNTWSNPENTVQNKKSIGETLGPFVVDFGIFSAGGAAGIGAGKMAAKKFFGNETGTRAFQIEKELRTASAPGAFTPAPTAGRNISAELHQPGLMTRDASVYGSTSSAMVARPLAKGVGVEGASFRFERGRTAHEGVGNVSRDRLAGSSTASRGEIEIPVVDLGARQPSLQKFPTESPLAQIFETGVHTVGKVEVLSVRGDLIQARTASAVSLGEGKLVTNYHVVENASEITIFDGLGRPHKAHTVKIDPTPDLAILQLRDRSSFDAFAEARFANRDKYRAPEQTGVVAVGHFDSHNNLTVSPGVIPHDSRQTALDLYFHGSVKNGNSGGALTNLAGDVIGIVKSGFDNGRGIASPSWQIDRVLKSGEVVQGPASRSDAVHTATTYSVENVAAARGNVEKLFGTALDGIKPPEFFHSKVKRVEVKVPGSTSKELVLQTQISPTSREVVVEPISWGGKPIAADQTWPGTLVPMSSARLNLRFEPGLGKAQMETVNDPLHLLANGFNYRSEGNYLASLVPQTTRLADAATKVLQKH